MKADSQRITPGGWGVIVLGIWGVIFALIKPLLQVCGWDVSLINRLMFASFVVTFAVPYAIARLLQRATKS